MKCPYCKERIKKDAVKCKHCHSDLVAVKEELDSPKKIDALLKEKTIVDIENNDLEQNDMLPEKENWREKVKSIASEIFNWKYLLFIVVSVFLYTHWLGDSIDGKNPQYGFVTVTLIVLIINSKSNKILVFFFGVIAYYLLTTSVILLMDKFTDNNVVRFINKTVSANKNLPKMLNGSIELSSIVKNSRTSMTQYLKYKYLTKEELNQSSDDFEAELIRIMHLSSCKKNKTLFENGLHLNLTYHDKNNRMLLETAINDASCKPYYKMQKMSKQDLFINQFLKQNSRLPIQGDIPNFNLKEITANRSQGLIIFHQVHIDNTLKNFGSYSKRMIDYKQKSHKTLLQETCNDKVSLDVLKVGISFEHRYYTEDGSKLFGYQIKYKDCLKTIKGQ